MVMTCAASAALPAASVASQLQTMVVGLASSERPALVTTFTTLIATGPPKSVASGVSKLQGCPSSTVRLASGAIAGAVVSRTVTAWEDCAELPLGSLACQVQIATKELLTPAFVTVLNT